MNGVAKPHALPMPRSREAVPLIREACLAGLFVALACSISASQILLAVLVVLAVPWHVAGDALADGAGPMGALRALWAASAALRRNPLARPLAAFVALTLLSAFLSGDPLWSLWIARDTVRISVFFLVLTWTRSTTHAVRLWQGFLGALSLMACYGLVQAWLCGGRRSVLPETWVAEICTHTTRIRGPFSIYMTFGGVLLVGALFFLAYFANVSGRRVLWMVPASAVTLAALAFTYSRNAWLGLLAGAFGVVLTARRLGPAILVLRRRSSWARRWRLGPCWSARARRWTYRTRRCGTGWPCGGAAWRWSPITRLSASGPARSAPGTPSTADRRRSARAPATSTTRRCRSPRSGGSPRWPCGSGSG